MFIEILEKNEILETQPFQDRKNKSQYLNITSVPLCLTGTFDMDVNKPHETALIPIGFNGSVKEIRSVGDTMEQSVENACKKYVIENGFDEDWLDIKDYSESYKTAHEEKPFFEWLALNKFFKYTYPEKHKLVCLLYAKGIKTYKKKEVK